MTSPLLRFVFVYGTLRRGEVRDINRLRPTPRWVGRGSVAGVLYDLGEYPGLLLQSPEAPHGRVHGEVYEVAAELERQLDVIEEVWPQSTGEYVRREVPVRMDREAGSSGPACPPELTCLLYEIAPDRAAGKPVITSGDWVSRVPSRAP